MESSEKIDSPQAEIDALRRRIVELETFAATQPEAEKNEAQSAKEAIKEHLQRPAEAFSEQYKLPEKEIESHAAGISNMKDGVAESDQAQERQILELMQMVETKGVLNTISVVEKTGDAYLQDAFHDTLAKYLQGLKK